LPIRCCSLVVTDFIGARIACNTRGDVDAIEALMRQNPRFHIIKREVVRKDSGYRALHLDVQYQIHWEDELMLVPPEIQIKTHLQNAWAEVTHDESYKPEIAEMRNEWEFTYPEHMADLLDNLDEMARTIRRQRLSYVSPPSKLDDADTAINHKTLSFTIDRISKGARLT
jgi:putative GTP pyrophosphokinase